jgi:hypothetical protein
MAEKQASNSFIERLINHRNPPSMTPNAERIFPGEIV